MESVVTSATSLKSIKLNLKLFSIFQSQLTPKLKVCKIHFGASLDRSTQPLQHSCSSRVTYRSASNSMVRIFVSGASLQLIRRRPPPSPPLPLATASGRRSCNILGFRVTKREETDVCITFMHRKSGEFWRQIKLVTVAEVLLELMELK
jgi:hypothetical protein